MATVTRKTKRVARQTLRAKVEKAGPSSDKLKQLAKSHHPPQSWYDETENPFEKPAK